MIVTVNLLHLHLSLWHGSFSHVLHSWCVFEGWWKSHTLHKNLLMTSLAARAYVGVKKMTNDCGSLNSV